MFTIKINTDNAAFEDEGVYEELARILEKVAKQLRDHNLKTTLLDINGNKVGTAGFKN